MYLENISPYRSPLHLNLNKSDSITSYYVPFAIILSWKILTYIKSIDISCQESPQIVDELSERGEIQRQAEHIDIRCEKR